MNNSVNASNVATADSKTEIRFGGFGGQGIVLAGTLLGKAASLFDGKEAVFTQAYGPEARGGASNADIVIDESVVDYPYISHPDILIVLFQEACNRFQPLLKDDGILIVEEDLVKPEPTNAQLYSIPASRIAEELGNKIVMNVVVLGFLIGLTHVVSRDSVEQAIKETVKNKALELNFRAFDKGYSYAQSLLSTREGEV